MSPVVKVAIKDQNESAGAVLLAPVDGAPIIWINDQRNSDGSSMSTGGIIGTCVAVAAFFGIIYALKRFCAWCRK